MKAVMFVDTIRRLSSNQALFSGEFLERGYDVHIIEVNTVALRDGDLSGMGVRLRDRVEIGSGLTGPTVPTPLSDAAVGWMLNQPHPSVARDVWQLLWLLNQRIWFVNDVGASYFLNSKSTLSAVVAPDHLPSTLVSNSATDMLAAYRAQPGPWILKPTNSGAGRQVFKLDPHSGNETALIQAATGDRDALYDMHDPALLGLAARYAVLQTFVPEANADVRRVIVAGGDVILHYGRRPSGRDHRSNYTHGGQLADMRPLTPDETDLCHAVAGRLGAYGIHFAGIDLAYPSVLELNLVNPGGLVNEPETSRDAALKRAAAAIVTRMPAARPTPTA